MTYVIRNILSLEHGVNVKTDVVRRRLWALERNRQVRLVPSPYLVHLCWAIPDPCLCRNCDKKLPDAGPRNDGYCADCGVIVDEVPF